LRNRTNKKVKVVINDNTYLVEFADLSASPLVVKVNGRPFQVAVEAVGEDMPAAAIPSSAAISTAVAPQSPVLSAARPTAAVTAPMPGNIVEIYVKEGDCISKDQLLCSLEAMKMQNAIRSSRDGVIDEVVVRPGQAVGYGELLFTFDRATKNDGA
jgi:biotin carboxyl carrier protein